MPDVAPGPLVSGGLPSCRYLARNRDGTVAVADIAHTSGPNREHRGLPRGHWPPGAMIGGLDLPFLPPGEGSPAQQADYAKLRHGQRIECYDRSAGLFADPIWTGDIDGLPADLKTRALHAKDTLGRLQNATTERDQYFTDSGINIIRYMLEDWDVLYGDDFRDPTLVMQDSEKLEGRTATLYGHRDTGADTWTLQHVPGEKGSVKLGPKLTAGANLSAAMHTGATWFDLAPPLKMDALFDFEIPPLVGMPLVVGEHYGVSASAGIMIGMNPTTGVGIVADLSIYVPWPGGGQSPSLWVQCYQTAGWGDLLTTTPPDFAPPIAFSLQLPGPQPMSDGWTRQRVQLGIFVNDVGAEITLNGQAVLGSVVLFDTSAIAGAVGIYGSIYNHWSGGSATDAPGTSITASDLYVLNRTPRVLLAPGFPDNGKVYVHNFNKRPCLEALMTVANDMDIDVRKVCKPIIDQLEAGPFQVAIAPTDLALGMTATGDSHTGVFVASNVTDGNDTTAWKSSTTPVTGRWVRVDLGEDTPIGGVRLRQIATPDDAVNGISAFKLQSSPDLSAWTDVQTFTLGHGDREFTGLLTAVATGRHWRILATTGGSGVAGIESFTLYGLPTFQDEVRGVGARVGNITTGGRVENSNGFATVVRMTGQASGSDPVMYEARDLPAIRELGFWTRDESQPDIVPYDSLVRAGDVMTALSADPFAAGDIEVDNTGQGNWREMDYGRLRLSKVAGMEDLTRQLIGYDTTDGSAKRRVLVEQYPNTMVEAAIQRSRSALDVAVGGSMEQPMTFISNLTGLVGYGDPIMSWSFVVARPTTMLLTGSGAYNADAVTGFGTDYITRFFLDGVLIPGSTVWFRGPIGRDVTTGAYAIYTVPVPWVLSSPRVVVQPGFHQILVDWTGDAPDNGMIFEGFMRLDLLPADSVRAPRPIR